MKNRYKLKNAACIDKNKRKKRIILSVVLSIILLPLLAIAIGAGAFAIWANTIPLDKNLLPTASAVPVFYDSAGQKLDYIQDDYIKPEEIPEYLANAFVALEDKRFYSHKGYDIVRIGGALLSNIKSGSVKEGASTITQQLVKNTHLSQDRTIERKLKEIAIAVKLEKEYSKDEILAMYLSVIYFGNGAYGVKQAAKLYFGKEPQELSLAECAALAGIVKNPKKYSPSDDNQNCTERKNLVLEVMYEQDCISYEEFTAASNEKIYKKNSSKSDCDYTFYIKKASEEVCGALGITKYQLNNSGIEIYTNLDRSVQSTLARQGRNETNVENSGVQSVSVVLDNKNRAVLGYYSSLPYDIKRQAGSVLKPIAVFAPSINENIVTLATPIVDEKIDFGGFSPNNFGGIYYGDTTVRESIKRSMNSVAVKVMDYLGTEKSAQYLQNFGINITPDDKNYALALGATANGVSPLEIANAYMSIANGGIQSKGSFVRFATENGVKVYSTEQNEYTASMSARVIENSTAAIITSALVDTVKDGTAKTLSALPFEVASKTGTAQRADGTNSDAWNVSYNDDVCVLVWHGSDESMTEKGGGYPTRHSLRIWSDLNGVFKFERHMSSCAETLQLDIDTYATKLNRTVTLASQNTPSEYRKTELFSKNNIPSSISCCFEEITDAPQFDLRCENGKAILEFASNEIYSYNVYRKDCLSTKLIAQVDGLSEKNVILYDSPLALWGAVEYEVECYITCNPTIKKSSVKQIFIENEIGASTTLVR